MNEDPRSCWDDFLTFKWMHRRDRAGLQSSRGAYTNQARQSYTKAYRAKRKRHNKAALAQRKINRQRCA